MEWAKAKKQTQVAAFPEPGKDSLTLYRSATQSIEQQ
jgi:hypothetical protein